MKLRDVFSIERIQQMLRQSHNRLAKLEEKRKPIAKQHARLSRKLEAIDSKIRALQGNSNSKPGRNGARARNDQNLPDVIEAVLKATPKPMKVGDITDGVLSRGYKSVSSNFRGIVNQTLIKDKRFTAASRGLYQLKSKRSNAKK
jgi:hypothetical protein